MKMLNLRILMYVTDTMYMIHSKSLMFKTLHNVFLFHQSASFFLLSPLSYPSFVFFVIQG